MDDIKILKYGHDRCVVIESSEGESDEPWWARLRDGGGFGWGYTHKEAVQSLIKNMIAEAKRIEEALEQSDLT